MKKKTVVPKLLAQGGALIIFITHNLLDCFFFVLLSLQIAIV